MPPDLPSMGHYAAAAYVGFAHKLGNPLPQILDPPLTGQCFGDGVDYIEWTNMYT